MKRLLVLSILLSYSHMFSQLKSVNYTDGKQKLIGFSSKPASSLASKPGVLILPAWKGIDNHSKTSAEELSKLGYYTFVADIYGEGNYPTNSQEAGKFSGMYKSNYQLYQKRIKLALDQLIKSGANPDQIAVIGYCFGGTGALEAARGKLPVKAVVSFHGGLSKDKNRINEKLDAKILVCHGADDPYVPQSEVDAFIQEMKSSEVDWQLIYYADAVHAFTEVEAGNDKSKGAAYNEKADKRSWQHMIAFFNEVFK